MRITAPRAGEPIRLVTTGSEPRFRVVMDAGRKADGGRRQVTSTFATLRGAREFVAETRTAVARGNYTAPAGVDFDALCSAWLASKVDCREVTRLGYAQVLKPIRARIGARKVQSIRLPDVEAVMVALATEGGQRSRPLSHRSLAYTLGTLRQVFAYAVRAGLVATNPTQAVKVPKAAHDDGRALLVWDPAQLLAFRAVADADEWAGGWRLALSGLRRSEVLGMAWEAVDMDAGTAVVRAGRVAVDGSRTATGDPKSKASRRTVPVEAMHPGTVGLLRSLSARQAAERRYAGLAYTDGGLVLVDALGLPVRPEAFSDRFGVLCRRAGVPVVRLHSVRHSVALMLHRAGVAPADAASLLGHSVQVHLSTYVPRTEQGAQTAGAMLGRVLRAAL